MQTTYGHNHNSFDKTYGYIIKYIIDLVKICVLRMKYQSIVVNFKYYSCLHATPYVIVITKQLGESAFR